MAKDIDAPTPTEEMEAKTYIWPATSGRSRTQKLKGIKGINKFRDKLVATVNIRGLESRGFFYCKIEKILEEGNEIPLAMQLGHAIVTLSPEGKIFCRPCPTRPRHGFVDSRLMEFGNYSKWPPSARSWISSGNSSFKVDAETAKWLIAFVQPLKKLAAEVYEQDKKGEIILMPYIDASLGAIYANGTLTAGEGNEGATSGHNTIVFPAADVWPDAIDKAFWEQFDIKNSPFIEFVYLPAKNDAMQRGEIRRMNRQGVQSIQATPIIVQLRDGPAMEMKSRDFISKRTKITRVIIPGLEYEESRNLLLGFEKAIEEAEEGVVVVHQGGAISSHYGIHCVMHGVPYITDPTLCNWIKMWWERKTMGHKSVDGADFYLDPIGNDVGIHQGMPSKADWIEGFMAGLRMECLPYAAEMIQTSLYFLHSSSAIDFSDPNIGYAFSFSLAQTVKLAAIALMGELRHGDVNITQERLYRERGCEISREWVYEIADKLPPELMIYHALEKSKAFAFPGWRSSIGGHNWHLCAVEAARLWNACVDYTNEATEDAFKGILMGLNNVIHASHNGAKMLTKFSSMNTMDLAVKCPPMMAAITLPMLWHLVHNRVSVESIALVKGPNVDEMTNALVSGETRRVYDDYLVTE